MQAPLHDAALAKVHDTMPPVRRGMALLLLHVGLALASVALSAWLVRRTALEPTRTAEVAEAVLESPELRQEIARQVSGRIGQETGELPFAIEPVVEEVLRQEETASLLGGTVVASHRRLLDANAPPVIIDTTAMNVLSQGRVPEQYTLAVPTIGPLATARRLIDDWLPTVAVVAALLVVAGVAVHPNPPRALCQAGYWMVAATLTQVAVGYVVPVIVVPAVSDSPWADVVATAVRAYGRTVVRLLATVLAGGAVALLAGASWGLGANRAYDP